MAPQRGDAPGTGAESRIAWAHPAIGGDDPRTLLIRLRDETRLGLVTLAARSPGEDLFEVQEELFS